MYHISQVEDYLSLHKYHLAVDSAWDTISDFDSESKPDTKEEKEKKSKDTGPPEREERRWTLIKPLW